MAKGDVIGVCPMCGKPVIWPRRKWCSQKCGRRAGVELQSAERRPLPGLALQSAMRKCLRCGEGFMSDGPWNRICGHCGESMAQEMKSGIRMVRMKRNY